MIIFRFFSHSFFTENFELIVKDFESRNLSLKGLTVLVGGDLFSYFIFPKDFVCRS